MKRVNRIKFLWENKGTFPRESAGKDVDGHCLVMLDDAIAGCITCFLYGGTKSPTLDRNRLRILEQCLSDLRIICTQLTEDELLYFQQLAEASEEVLKFCKKEGMVPGEGLS